MLIFCQKKKHGQSKKCYTYRNANKDRFIWGHADLAANFYEYLNTTWFNYPTWRGSISFVGSCACSSERKFLQFCFFLQLCHTKVRIKFQSWPPDGTYLPCPIGLVHHHRCSQPLVRHCPVSITSLDTCQFVTRTSATHLKVGSALPIFWRELLKAKTHKYVKRCGRN